MLCSLVGTPWLPQANPGILFLEDVNEHPFRIERMLTQLLNAGILAQQKAILLGQFTNYRTVPHDKGRVLTESGGAPVTGLYAAGWIKRGPSGVIGTNKPDSVETVESLLEDLRAGKINGAKQAKRSDFEALLKSRSVRAVSFEDWLILDVMEIARGEAAGRPRVKFDNVEEMLGAIEAYKQKMPSGTGD